MSDFYFLENLSIQIQENRKKLEDYDIRLNDINLRLHEIPLHRSTESSFAKMIGASYDDQFSDLEKAKENLEEQRQQIENLVDQQLESFRSEITSKEFVIPLDPK